MNDLQWKLSRYFSADEAWGDPRKMRYELIFELDRLRDYVQKPIIIHSGYRENSRNHKTGYHADIHIEGMHHLDQFIVASRFGFTAIGLYPYWNNPGLHLGADPAEEWRRLWGKDYHGDYVGLTGDFLMSSF
jgi:uncharacterized protein YcbK (DUF882 family)